MASAGVAASQSSRKWAAWRFAHAQRAGCWTSGAPLRAVERSLGSPSNRLADACEKLHETRTGADHRLASQIGGREAPQELVFELFLRLVSFEALAGPRRSNLDLQKRALSLSLLH